MANLLDLVPRMQKTLKLNASGSFDIPDDRRIFGNNFIFGTCSAAYQFEGAASEGGRGPCAWDIHTRRYPGKVADGSNGNIAVDSYHMYKEDVQIMKKMGIDAHRISISWSRLLPDGRLSGGVNKEAIKYYNDLINELLANGITPFVTLFHFDLPQALQDEYGGFLDKKIVDDFRDYAEVCFWEFGDRVKYWITLNEPWSYSVAGYVWGTFPPARGHSPKQTNTTIAFDRYYTGKERSNNDGDPGNPGTEPYTVSHNQLLAHAAVVKLYRENFKTNQNGQIGIVLVTRWMEPLDRNKPEDIEAAKRALDFNLGWFLAPITYGDYPQTMKDYVKPRCSSDPPRLPVFSPDDKHNLKGSYDFLGINYYTARYVTTATCCKCCKPGTKKCCEHSDFNYLTDPCVTIQTVDKNGKDIGEKVSDWLYIYKEGIKKLVIYIKENYGDDKPIYITENGVSEPNENNVPSPDARKDVTRIKYHHDHLEQLYEAIVKNKVNVQGYFVWSFSDNFEWQAGYTVRFGLIHVSYKNELARYPKSSAIWYRNFLTK